MGHRLQAALGPSAVAEAFARRWAQARVVALPQGFALVPLTPVLTDDVDELTWLDRRRLAPSPHPSLSAGVAAVLAEASAAGPLAYVETDSFGGVGEQHAAVWERGAVVLGPLASRTAWDDERLDLAPPEAQAINRALRRMGVTTRGGQDPFDALGLGRYRDTEDAAERGRSVFVHGRP